MKNVISNLIFIIIGLQSAAQNTPCRITNASLHNVYVFSEERNHVLNELLGAETNPMLINLIYVNSEEQKKEIDDKVLEGRLEGSMFIFPGRI